MAPEIERITNTFLSNPARIEVARQATASETITQQLFKVSAVGKDQQAKAKRNLLRTLIDQEGSSLTNALIFCNRKVDVDIVSKSLKKYGYIAEAIHGDLEQSQRTKTLDGFREGNIRLLVASDVAARGLDISSVSHVFNFDVPINAEDYIHRIGRTGRAGRSGKAITISTSKDEKFIDAINSLIGTNIPLQTISNKSKPEKVNAPKEPKITKIEPKVVLKENIKRSTSLKPSQTSVKPLKTEPNVKKEEVLTDASEMPNFITQSFEERQK
jgi:ATP-dependent RNA helicase RhlE